MSALDAILPLPAPAWPEGLPEHVSPSSLKTYMRCREQWRRRYIDRDHERSAHYFVWGGAHNRAIVETNFEQKIRTGTDLPVPEVQEAFAAAVDHKINAAGGPSEVEWGDVTRGDIIDRGAQLVAAYMEHAAPQVQPVAVEERFEIRVAGVPVPVVGYLDVRERDRVVEVKTAGKRELAPADRFQGRMYQLAFPLPVDFHVATKTRTPAVYTSADVPEFGIPADDRVIATTGLMVANVVADIAATFERFGPDGPWPGGFTARGVCSLCSFRASCGWAQ